MFKYTAQNPESALSVLAAAFRLYFASFLYSLTLSVIATLTFLSTNFVLVNYLEITNQFFVILPIVLSSSISLVFFIPLIKRIYSVGAELPISTARAYDGFFIHFFRMLVFILLCVIASAIIPGIWTLINPQINPNISMVLLCLLVVLYIYIGLKIYFTAMFIILENKAIFEAIKASFRIEFDHMWLTFCVLSLYFLGYWAVTSMMSGYIVWDSLGIDLPTEIFSVIALPLFLSIQICQFMNLKRLSK